MGEYKFSQQFVRNVCSGPIKIILNTLTVFFSYRYFLQVFGPNQYSIWILLAVIIDFSRLGNFGINEIIIKYIAEIRSTGDKKMLYAFSSTSLFLIIMFSLLLIVALFGSQNLIISIMNLAPEKVYMFKALYDRVLLVSFMIIIMEFLLGILFGIGRADLANYFQFGSNLLGTFLSITLVYYNFGLMGLYWGTFCATLLILVVCNYYIYKILGNFPFKIGFIKKTLIKDILKNSMLMFSASVINLFFIPAGKLLLSRYVGSVEVVSYDLAFKLCFQIRSLFDIALKAMVPEVCVIQYDKLRQLVILKKMYIGLILTALPIYSGIYFSSQYILKFWLASAYLPIINDSFRTILIGIFIGLFVVPIYFLLLGQGHFKNLLISYFIQSMLLVVPSILYFEIFSGSSYYIFLYMNDVAMILTALYLFYVFYKINEVKL